MTRRSFPQLLWSATAEGERKASLIVDHLYVGIGLSLLLVALVIIVHLNRLAAPVCAAPSVSEHFIREASTSSPASVVGLRLPAIKPSQEGCSACRKMFSEIRK